MTEQNRKRTASQCNEPEAFEQVNDGLPESIQCYKDNALILTTKDPKEKISKLFRKLQNDYNLKRKINFHHFYTNVDENLILNYINPLKNEKFNESPIKVNYFQLLNDYADKINLQGIDESKKLEHFEALRLKSQQRIKEYEEIKLNHRSILENTTNPDEKLKQINILKDLQTKIDECDVFTIVNYFNPSSIKFYNNNEDDELYLEVESKINVKIQELLTIYPTELCYLTEDDKKNDMNRSKQSFETLMTEQKQLKDSISELEENKKDEELLDELKTKLKINFQDIENCKLWDIFNKPYCGVIKSLKNSFNGYSKLKPTIFLLSVKDHTTYESSLIKKYYHDVLNSDNWSKIRKILNTSERRKREIVQKKLEIQQKADFYKAKPSHLLCVITYRDSIFIVDGLFDGFLINLADKNMQHAISAIPCSASIYKLLEQFGYKNKRGFSNSAKNSSIPYSSGTKITSVLIPNFIQFNEQLKDEAIKLNVNPIKYIKDEKEKMRNERKLNKDLRGLPFLKERIRFCVKANPLTNFCECKKNSCFIEYKCRMCFINYQKEFENDQNVEYKCCCRFVEHKNFKEVQKLFDFCKVSQTVDCKQQNQDSTHVCEIVQKTFVEKTIKKLCYDQSIYYCRNPLLPEHKTTLKKQKVANDAGFLQRPEKIILDIENCRNVAINFVGVFANMFAEHQFHAFEILFGEIGVNKTSTKIIPISH
ncbi:hypothetical protein ACKWTF_014550 [Chironomus riparius]